MTSAHTGRDPKALLLPLPRTSELEAALARASEEVGLQDYYRDCVRPLLGVGSARWPRCCGGRCEPCAQTLVAVAERVHELLGVIPDEA